jgi:ADP-ribosylglycohydrolase
MSKIPEDYEERVYAGVLGKLIGVYLGRPFEGWLYSRIMEELGEIKYYVHERLNKSLVVVDDDLSGTFTFLRSLPDHGNHVDLTAAQIGQAWLNYLIEERTTLWWGGLGNSTEHTAYLRLKQGIPAPHSGSIALNGKIVAEQIGAQIFIDGWGMVCPGDPELAASLARRAASVSHDGEAIYAAQVIAAMIAQAFTEPYLDGLLDTAVTFIPTGSVIYRLIADLREWRSVEDDWREARKLVEDRYGYDKYPGNCHVVPNHGLIILSLLYGDDDFQKSLMIVNTCGWDTDCNSGNVGCLLGIKNGLKGIDRGPDWRGPVADRLYISSADGGRAISDAVIEAYHVANIGRALYGEASSFPKEGARFHFEQPGAVQGFRILPEGSNYRELLNLENVPGHSRKGKRSLALRSSALSGKYTGGISTPTFIPPEAITNTGYGLAASPTLYPGQLVKAGLLADESNHQAIGCRLFTSIYGADDRLCKIQGPLVKLSPGEGREIDWRIEDTAGAPIVEIGLELAEPGSSPGVIYLDYLTWNGAPDTVFKPPPDGGKMWRRAWVDAVDRFVEQNGVPFWLVQNRGRGLIIQGTNQWSDYKAEAVITPHLVRQFGLALRVQGLQRYYALLLCNDMWLRLVKVMDGEQVLAEVDFDWRGEDSYRLGIQARGSQVQAWIDGEMILEAEDEGQALAGGGVGLVCDEGCISTSEVRVGPVNSNAE